MTTVHTLKRGFHLAEDLFASRNDREATAHGNEPN